MGAVKTLEGFALKILLTALAVLISPVTLIVAAVSLLLLRPFVAMLARVMRPDLAEIMYNKGQLFAFEPVYTTSSMTILMHLVCDGTISLESLRQQFRRQLMPSVWNMDKRDDYVRLRQLWTQYWGYLFWQWESDFSVEKHVRYYDYDTPELALPKGICSEEDLKGITGTLNEKAYTRGQSPWEMLLIQNYKSSSNMDGHPQCVIVLRMHHTLTDIMSMIKMILRLFDQEAASLAKARFRQTPLAEKLRKNLKVALRAPYDFVSNLVDIHDGKNCWSVIEKKRLTKKYHTLLSNPIPVVRIKEIMKKYGVSYNAAVYSITAGAVVRLMIESDQKVPAQLSAFLPYPLPSHPGGLVNHWSLDSFNFQPAIHSSPRQRLTAISKNVVPASVFAVMPIINNWALTLLLLLPPKLTVFVCGLAHVTLGMTNVPGPDEHLDVMGTAKLVEIIPLMGHPMLTAGAVAMMISVGGKQRIGLAVHWVNFEGHKLPTNFARYIDEEIEQLLD